MIAQQESVYTPSEWGLEFHGSTADELCGAGSAGPGKSTVLQADALPFVVLEHERAKKKEIRRGESAAKFLFLRRELGMLEDTIGRARRLFRHVDEDVQFKEELGKTVATFPYSGAKFIWGGCKDLHDYAQYQGPEYLRVYYDELWQFEKEQYDQINTRVRTPDPVLSPFLGIRSATNPYPNWVRTYFVDPAPKGRVLLRRKYVSPSTGKTNYRTRMFLPATLYDNPNKEFVEQYEISLMDKPAHIRNALLYGDWYINVGAFYSEEWRRDLHVVRPFLIPGHWTRFRSMDWGYKTHGIVGWWAVNEDGDLICEREYLFRYRTATQVAKRIKDIEEEMGLWDSGRNRSKLTGPADTQLWEERGETAISKAEEMAKVGVTWTKANKSSRAKNAGRFVARLLDHGDGTTLPGIVFFDTCSYCIKTIPAMQTDPHNPEEPVKNPEDHGHDMTLYACAYRAAPGNDNTRDWYDDDDDEHDELAERRRSRGQLGYGGH